MINITRAQATQSTTNGINGPWIVSLDEEELYRLPPHTTVQETFAIRDIIEKMMKRVAVESKEAAKLQCDVRINKLAEHRDSQLNLLKAENERLATILEKHLGVN